MIVHSENFFTIIWGSAHESLVPAVLKNASQSTLATVLNERFEICLPSNKQHYVLPHHVHGNNGLVIHTVDEAEQLEAYTQSADFSCTAVPEVALAVTAADCAPIIMVDTKNRAIAAVHAGWRGTLADVAVHALQTMHTTYGTSMHDVHIFYGPSMRSCCYKVGQEVVDVLTHNNRLPMLTKRDGHNFFDIITYNKQRAREMGVPLEQHHTQYASCTYCTPGFCSSRKSNGAPDRQLNFVILSDRGY